MKNISILGSTGSIGRNTLDIVARNPARFAVPALAAGRNLSLIKRQIDKFRPEVVSVIDGEHADRLGDMLGHPVVPKILSGDNGYREIASWKKIDMVVSAISGAAGLLPTIEAIDAGKDIALANKETMVMAGELVVDRAAARGSGYYSC